VQDHARTSYKISQGVLQSLHGLLQDLAQNLVPGPKIFSEHPAPAARQAPLIQIIFQIFMQGPLREDPTRISTRSFQRLLQGHARTLQRIMICTSSQDLLIGCCGILRFSDSCAWMRVSVWHIVLLLARCFSCGCQCAGCLWKQIVAFRDLMPRLKSVVRLWFQFSCSHLLQWIGLVLQLDWNLLVFILAF